MHQIHPCALPQSALLQRYAGQDGYADCFQVAVPGAITHAAFIEAFYTTRLFKLERLVLALLAGRPSSDQDARQLAEGSASTFAAWRVEERTSDQLLLGDFTGRTKSWLMAVPGDTTASAQTTHLYFGSAVVPRTDKSTGTRKMGFAFTALLGFHKLYSRLLLRAAAARLTSTT